MTFAYDGFNYTLRFNKGEQFVEQLTKFVSDKNIRGGWIVGLGGFSWAEIGYYNLESQDYKWTKYDGPLELTNLTGNIAWKDNDLALHLHATISGIRLEAVAGHLKEAEVSGTVEIFLHVWDNPEGLNRSRDTDTGLNLLDL